MDSFYVDLFSIVEYDFTTNRYIIEVYDINNEVIYDPKSYYPGYNTNNQNVFFTLQEIYDVFYNYTPILSDFIIIKLYNYKFNTNFKKPFLLSTFDDYRYFRS